MTIKELKELIKDVPDDADVYIDYEYESDDYGWTSEEEEAVHGKYMHSTDNYIKEFHICSYKEN